MFGKNLPPKEKIKDAWDKGDFTGILEAGWENFLRIIFDHPLSFHKFLEYTGEYLDNFILDTCTHEHLDYVGGKLILSVESTCDREIQLAADFYFQNSSGQWILKKKSGRIGNQRLSDYDSSPELAKLRECKKIEYPIDPPRMEGSQ